MGPHNCAFCARHHRSPAHFMPVESTRETLVWNPALEAHAHGWCVFVVLVGAGRWAGIDFSPIYTLAAGVETHRGLVAESPWLAPGAGVGTII